MERKYYKLTPKHDVQQYFDRTQAKDQNQILRKFEVKALDLTPKTIEVIEGGGLVEANELDIKIYEAYQSIKEINSNLNEYKVDDNKPTDVDFLGLILQKRQKITSRFFSMKQFKAQTDFNCNAEDFYTECNIVIDQLLNGHKIVDEIITEIKNNELTHNEYCEKMTKSLQKYFSVSLYETSSSNLHHIKQVLEGINSTQTTSVKKVLGRKPPKKILEVLIVDAKKSEFNRIKDRITTEYENCKPIIVKSLIIALIENKFLELKFLQESDSEISRIFSTFLNIHKEDSLARELRKGSLEDYINEPKPLYLDTKIQDFKDLFHSESE